VKRCLILCLVLATATRAAAAPSYTTRETAFGKIQKTCADSHSPECRDLAESFLLKPDLTNQPMLLGLPTLDALCRTERTRAADECPIEMLACRRIGEALARRMDVAANWPLATVFLERASSGGDAVASTLLAHIHEGLNKTSQARESYARACQQKEFQTSERGFSDEQVQRYRDVVAESCTRSKEEEPSPVPTTTPCGALPRRLSGRVFYPTSRYPLNDRSGSRGEVVVELTVGTDGHVSRAHVVDGKSPFAEAAILSIEGWDYVPARCDETSLPVTIRVSVKFNYGNHPITIDATGRR